ncbi:MAG: hypothetical protein K2K51_03745 [Bacteroidales bacterium]|nr:hypothetical protein [Bacteroidales bacterium]
MEKQYGQHVGGRETRLWLMAAILGLGGSLGLLSAQTIEREVLSSGGETKRQTLGFDGELCVMTWTIGEPIGETYAGSKKIISQGFLQGEGFIRDTIDMDTAWTSLAVEAEQLVEVLLYPNPTHGPLQVVLNPVGAGHVMGEALLTDMRGRRLYHGPAGRLPWRETLDLSAYPAGTYLLNLTLRLSLDGSARQTEAVRVKTYKIIKN